MAIVGPWDDEWQVNEKLSKGAQGTTYCVKRKSDGLNAVLKEFKGRTKEKARIRAHQGVTNQKILYDIGCSVPNVLDSNTDEYKDPHFCKLYFVMDKIEGETLNIVVEGKRPTLREAIAFALSLCDTVDKALEHGIVHRDLKPSNIMVPDVEKPDLVIIDYGLSFNRSESKEITETKETLDNTFLSLPERRVPGGDRRDPRSDITGIIGILFYCLTGEAPVDLRDSNDMPPHRRANISLKDCGDQDVIFHLESLFDKGFQLNIDLRFQSIAELEERIMLMLNPKTASENIDIAQFVSEFSDRIITEDKTTRLSIYAESASGFTDQLRNKLSRLENIVNEKRVFKLEPHRVMESDRPSGDLLAEFQFTVQNRHNPQVQAGIAYTTTFLNGECWIYRRIFTKDSKDENRLRFHPVTNWIALASYSGPEIPKGVISIAQKDMERALADAIRAITRVLKQS